MKLRVGLLLFSSVFLFACHSTKKAGNASGPSKKETTTSAREAKKEIENKVNKALETAFMYKGVPYRMGGTDKKGMDCSGLINISYKAAGITLPRTTAELLQAGKPVDIKEVEKGDLLFFATKKKSAGVTHVGMVDNLSQKYYQETFVKAIRPF
jgi:cell wall-associated NlpC family hydrolase